MRVTVCELPHEETALASAWAALCEHTARCAAELVLLPEFATVEAVWESEVVDPSRWAAIEARAERWLQRLPELGAAHVVGTRPVSIDGRRFNQGFVMSAADGLRPLRSKHFRPDEAGSWEARWFEKGDADFPVYRAGALGFGLNICSELWALESYAEYARHGAHAILSPRATSAATVDKWRSVGVVAAVRSGAFSLSSNRVDPSGACGGGGWVIDPDGEILAMTDAREPFATVDIEPGAAVAARARYPRYVFERRRSGR